MARIKLVCLKLAKKQFDWPGTPCTCTFRCVRCAVQVCRCTVAQRCPRRRVESSRAAPSERATPGWQQLGCAGERVRPLSCAPFLTSFSPGLSRSVTRKCPPARRSPYYGGCLNITGCYIAVPSRGSKRWLFRENAPMTIQYFLRTASMLRGCGGEYSPGKKRFFCNSESIETKADNYHKCL